MNTWERFNETVLPNKKAFYSELYLDDITGKDYTHAQKVFEEFQLKNLGDYHDLYLQGDTLLLADVFENFRDKCSEIELVTDIDMLLMVEKGIRGGICHAIHRYAEANNKYIKNYDKSTTSS